MAQVKRKGRSVHVEPVEGMPTDELREVIQALLLLQQGQSGSSDEASDASSAAAGSPAAVESEGSTASRRGGGPGDQGSCAAMQTVSLPSCALLHATLHATPQQDGGPHVLLSCGRCFVWFKSSASTSHECQYVAIYNKVLRIVTANLALPLHHRHSGTVSMRDPICGLRLVFTAAE